MGKGKHFKKPALPIAINVKRTQTEKRTAYAAASLTLNDIMKLVLRTAAASLLFLHVMPKDLGDVGGKFSNTFKHAFQISNVPALTIIVESA